jgi:hypothetical protein
VPPDDRDYSTHARERMEERGITEADVETALKRRIGHPGPGEPGTVWMRGHAAGGRILKVCIRLADGKIITLAWEGG